ncbi:MULTISPECIES: vitamin K epoxide reductase family protein [Microbacterium]|uniref:Vitamin K epoxide reductase family protein n=1 Tax=Microbacterium algihabitans TaxID=3075992 RepID=A0ABU3RUS5_9MICO|nr:MULTISPECIES: vitamin K epoxide reductase family protein [Microbacterium]MDU0326632.1 vitamin K epoxide reductase family protein [Microbacterium sp. KSW2-21]
MSETVTPRRPVVVAIWLIFAGVVGWWAAFSLTMERFAQLQNPGTAASCDFSVLVQCSANLQSAQGSVFGFPNPIIGLGAWIAPIVVGMALLAGARFARWFWVLFWLGFVFAISFVIWLISQSLFVLATLCPWCMVTWSVVIPSFFVVTLHVLREGVIPRERVREVADRLMAWVPLMTIVAFVVVAVIAQLRLNVLAQL